MRIVNNKKYVQNNSIDEILYNLAKRNNKTIPNNIHNNVLKTINQLDTKCKIDLPYQQHIH